MAIKPTADFYLAAVNGFLRGWHLPEMTDAESKEARRLRSGGLSTLEAARDIRELREIPHTGGHR